MKKAVIFFAAVLAFSLAACGSPDAQSTSGAADNATSDENIKIVTTIFPEYDWVKNILGDNPANAEVVLLLDNGVDLHSYQPTAEDIMNINDCDMFIYVGGESDAWVDAALAGAENKDRIVLNLLDILGDSVKEEETVEGMQEEEEEHDDFGEEETEYDEHVWLSLKNAAVLVNKIEEAIETIDEANAGIYDANAESYCERLKALDAEYMKAVESAKSRTLLFGDRFPFRYLTDDYGLEYFAAFPGCSAETEASFETVMFLADKADELSLGAVMTIEGSNQGIAETIVENTGTKDQKILTMDSMQSSSSGDFENGKTYLSVMESNLEVLKEALS